MPALVSILIPCFNCAPWVHRSLETAIGQTWQNKEVIVLDDGSTDNSLEIIRRYKDKVFIATQSNGGQNVSRNHLTQLSRGEWLVYLDADDELALDSVERKMAQTADADAVYGTIEVASFLEQKKTRFSIQRAEQFEDAISAALQWKFPNTSAFLFRKSAIVDAGPWNPAIRNCTDYDMYFKLLLKGKCFRAAPDSVSLYRQWSVINQAVYQDIARRTRTALDLKWRVAKELESAGQFTTARKESFANAAFRGIRQLWQINTGESRQEHERLIAWDPGFHPKASSKSYDMAYRLGGFAFAEHIAKIVRRLNPVKKPQPGVDPQSGLPYV